MKKYLGRSAYKLRSGEGRENITVRIILLVLFIVDLAYQYGFRSIPLNESVQIAIFDALLYTAVFWATMQCELTKITLCFLVLPYFIFIFGWLNLPTVIILIPILIYCFIKAMDVPAGIPNQKSDWHNFLAFLLILIWVNISGAGGYGFQWGDYGINNARLHDLVVNDWPIRYGENQNLVYYFGYFLPSAIIGKLFSVDIAIRSMYLWTVLGITLVIRWLSYLCNWRFSVMLVLAFIFFGPMDVINVLYSMKHHVHSTLDSWQVLPIHSNYIFTYADFEFVTNSEMGTPLGNYLSNVFQLYWSPQQTIAGWLCAGLIMHQFLQRKMKQIIFIYALLCLWGPLVMIALSPFVLTAVLSELPSRNWRSVLTFENTLGAGSITFVFVVFYLGGSAMTNPSSWALTAINWRAQWDVLSVFYLASWGIYTLVLIPFIVKCEFRLKLWFICLIFTLVILPLRAFGEWGDLLCRGSAPLMFLILIFLLRAVHYYWFTQNKLFAAVLLCVLIPGSGSAIKLSSISVAYYGQTQPVNTLLSYENIYPNLGPDNSLFERLFRRKLPNNTPVQ